MSLTVTKVKEKLCSSVFNKEYGDIRSILDEVIPTPLWSEQVALTCWLSNNLNDAIFAFDGAEHGWSYIESGD